MTSGRVAVLGGSGFLGSYVCTALIERGASVACVSLTPPRSTLPRLEWIQVDDRASFDRLACDLCIHLGEPNVVTDPASGQHNLSRAQRVLAAPFRRIVYVSSSVVYGDRSPGPRRETDPVDPHGLYASSKLAVEALIRSDARCVIARLANAYGDGMSSQNVMTDILTQLTTAGAMRLRDLAPVRDYVHASDVADALVRLGEAECAGIFNVGTGVGTSVRQLAELACTVAGQPGRELVATQPGDHPSTLILDIDRARRDLGWSPAITWKDGFSAMIREHLR